MKIIATIKKSVGNETVGEMWSETKIFDETQAILEVFEWAKNISAPTIDKREQFRRDIILTVAQD